MCKDKNCLSYSKLLTTKMTVYARYRRLDRSSCNLVSNGCKFKVSCRFFEKTKKAKLGRVALCGLKFVQSRGD